MRIPIVLATFLVLSAVPLAAADQNHPDCEDSVTYDSSPDPGSQPETGPQPGIGYTTTQAFWEGWQDDLGSPGGIFVCEGEHWDGEDTVQDDQGAPLGTARLDPDDLFIGVCSSPDMNDDPSADPTCPGVRVSSDGAHHFVGANVPLVGRAIVYADDSTVAIYLRDNMIANVLATVVSAAGITQGHVDENDCDQETYQSGAMQRDRSLCGRDNTAITVEHALLA